MNNVFSISGLLIFITSVTLVIILFKAGKSILHRIWLLFNVSIALWGLGAFFIGQSQDASEAYLWWKIAHIGIIFLPVFIFHLSYILCDLKQRRMLHIIYLQGFIFTIINLIKSKNLFLFDVRIAFGSLFYGEVTGFYHLFIIIWLLIVFYAHFRLFLAYRSLLGAKRMQIAYLLSSTILGFVGGGTNFLVAYKIDIFPIGNFTIPLYSVIVTYAILKYRLLDVTIAITRTGIFILVYSFVLGIPFAMAFGWRERLIALIGSNWWVAPLISSTVLATAGPFLYLFIQKRAEDRLLGEQKRYQATLKQASAGMTRIKDLKKLLNLIVYILGRAVNLEYTYIYLYDSKNKRFNVEAIRGRKVTEESIFLMEDAALIQYLERLQAPVVYEEVKQRNQDFGGQEYAEIEQKMKELGAEVMVPISTEKQLIAIGVLGKKRSGEMFTPDDLAVFSILANQVALAIENAQFYEESKRTHEQLFQAEKMATIGTMADGLSHQINNRLHALGFIAGDALDTIKLKGASGQSPDELRELLRDVTGALLKIQDNVRQGGEIVQGLLRYTRKGEEGFGPVDFNKLIDASVEMAQFKIKKDQLAIIKDYPADVPAIHGNFTQLQEVVFNIIDNAYDAVVQRKTERSEPGYQGSIKISTRRLDGMLEINILDNGMGIKDEDQHKLFTPFFTTKLSSKKGTGLGLYVIKKIIEENHKGRVFMSSEAGAGTLTVIKLPIEKK